LRREDLAAQVIKELMVRTGLPLSVPGTQLDRREMAENMRRAYDISREQQDRYALESHRRASAAVAGKFDSEIVPILVPGQAAPFRCLRMSVSDRTPHSKRSAGSVPSGRRSTQMRRSRQEIPPARTTGLLVDRQLFRNKVAIVGFGIAQSLRHAEVPVGSIGVDTADQAIKDAGLTRKQIDGVACGVSLPAYGSERVLRSGTSFVDSNFLINQMELEPRWWYDDASFPPALVHAVQAVASGAANYVLVNRTLHNPAGRYNTFAAAQAAGSRQWTAPYGYVAPTSGIAMPYMEYQQRFGMKREHMATLALQIRKNVQHIPQAYWFGRELTFDDYMNCRMISEPMCLFDNDIPVDGGGSFIITTAERALDLPNKPVYVTDWALTPDKNHPVPGTCGSLDKLYEPTQEMARQLWNRTGWRPEDVRVVQMYDGFMPLVLFWLETLGFCPVGEAFKFIQDGRIEAGGEFPLLSGGGNLGWGRIHGVPHVLECYWQLSGRAGERQISGATTGLSTYSVPGLVSATAILYSSDAAA
jgi:acetyl-CoA acetyltransferase